MPEQIFRELYFCEPSDDAGNPFGIGHIAAYVAPMSTAEPVTSGIDLARSQDYTVCIGLDADGAVCRFERWQSPWELTFSRILAIVGTTRALVDSTGVGDPIVERLQSGRSNYAAFHFTQSTKQQLMERLSVAIQQGGVRFPDGPIRDELETFEYEYSRTGVRYEAPACTMTACVCPGACGEAR